MTLIASGRSASKVGAGGQQRFVRDAIQTALLDAANASEHDRVHETSVHTMLKDSQSPRYSVPRTRRTYSPQFKADLLRMS